MRMASANGTTFASSLILGNKENLNYRFRGKLDIELPEIQGLESLMARSFDLPCGSAILLFFVSRGSLSLLHIGTSGFCIGRRIPYI